MGRVAAPTIIERPAHPNNYSRGRVGGRNGQFTFHHVVGTAESAATVFANPARQASSTYTVTDVPGVVFQHVHLDNTPYTDGNAASNARSVTCEHHGDWRFGYRNETVIANSALLVAWLRDQGIINHSYRHRDVSQIATSCSADLPIEEIWNRATAIINAAKGAPAVPPANTPAATITWTKLAKPADYILTKDTSLWAFGGRSWPSIKAVQHHRKGERITIYGKGYNKALNATYLVTEYSFNARIANGFNQADMRPAPAPVVAPRLTRSKLAKPAVYVLNKDGNLWDFAQTSWGGFGTGVKAFKKGDRVTIYGQVVNHNVGATFLQTEHSYTKGISHGFNAKDLTLHVAPPAPPKAEWLRNLKDIKPVKLTVLAKQTPIVNLVDQSVIKMLGAGTVVDFVKTTTVNGTEYLISSYSASTGAAAGIVRSTVGVPAAPPTSEKPAWLDRWEDIADVEMWARADTDLVNLDNGETVKTITRGEKVRIASTTEWFGHRYAITEYSTGRKEGRGIRMDDLNLKPVSDAPVTPAPNQPTIQVDRSWLEGISTALGKLLGR